MERANAHTDSTRMHRVNVQLDDELYRFVVRQAKARHLPLATFVRSLIVDFKSKVDGADIPKEYQTWRKLICREGGPIYDESIPLTLNATIDLINEITKLFRDGEHDAAYRLWRSVVTKYPQLYVEGLSPEPAAGGDD